MSDYFRPLSPKQCAAFTNLILGRDPRRSFVKKSYLFQEALQYDNPPDLKQRLEGATPTVCCIALSGQNFGDLYANRKSSYQGIGRASFFMVFLREHWRLLRLEIFDLHNEQISRDEARKRVDLSEAFASMEQRSFWRGLQSTLVGLAISRSRISDLESLLYLRTSLSEKSVENAFLDAVARAFISHFGLPNNYEFRPRGATTTKLRPH